MLYNFYNWYDIDDSQMGCWKIIQVNCEWLHSYVNPCDLIESCLLHIPQQLSKQCVVDFFNTTIDSIPAWYVLRVNWSHCIEAVPLVINDTDKYVWVSANDTPWYLNQKLVWSVVNDWLISVTQIWAMGNQQLEVSVVPPAWVKPFPGNPACDWAVLTGDADGSLHRNCGNSGNTWYWAVRYTSSDITPPLITDIYRSYFFTTSADRWGTALAHYGTMDIFQWENSMKWLWSYDGMIRIPKTWMYEVRMKWEVVINNWVSRVRLFLWCPKATNPKIILDSKFWGETALTGEPTLVYRELESMTVTLQSSWLIYLQQWEYVALWAKVDTRDATSASPEVTFRHTVYDLYDVGPAGSISEVDNAWPGLCFGVKRYSASIH